MNDPPASLVLHKSVIKAIPTVSSGLDHPTKDIKAIPTVSSGLDHPTKDERPPRTHIRRISGEHPSVSAERNRTSLLCYCGYSPTPRYDAQLSPAMSARSRCGVYVLRMFKDVSTAGRSFTLRPFKYGPRSTIGTI
ncbi:hypothetical protein QE152_g29280 [Popillia japonica]|uniref:Uncharacterized protein n=1 Tax=Popillia japonica TaxID=7064 RepID=A0AAW1JI18_POPJA